MALPRRYYEPYIAPPKGTTPPKSTLSPGPSQPGANPIVATPSSEDELRRKFAEARVALKARQEKAKESALADIARRAEISGGPTGATDKIRRKALTELETGFGAEEAGLGSEEAGALAQQKFQEKQLAQQESQFARTLDFQNKEFRENLRTNLINASIALTDAGMNGPDAWDYIFRAKGLIGKLAPAEPTGPTYVSNFGLA